MSSTANQEETIITSTTTANLNHNDFDHVAVAIPPITTTTTTTSKAIRRHTTMSSSTSAAFGGGLLLSMSMRAAGKCADAHDDELLHRAVADAGRWAYGTIFVEVWLLNEERTELYRPEAGWWIDPIYHHSSSSGGVGGDDDDDDGVVGQMISRLTDKTRKDYCPPTPVAPGVGLPGVLWTQDKSPMMAVQKQAAAAAGPAGRHVPVVWRDVKALAADHDQPWDARLQLLAELGLGWAAAVPLIDPHVHVGNEKQGIVIYMARDGVDGRRLRSFRNETYLVSASNFVAAALAVRGPRQEAMRERRAEVESAIRRVRAKLTAIGSFKQDLRQVIQENEQKRLHEQQKKQAIRPDQVQDSSKHTGVVMTTLNRFGFLLRRRVVSTLRKCRGANVKPPPTFSWYQSGFTFFGVFLTTLALTFFSKGMVDAFGSDYSLVMGPFGALLTLLYGLFGAPAVQPRNCIVGQIISMTIALAFSYIDGLADYPQLRSSIVTASCISAMVKLGMTHPPAGAMALLFSEGGLGWTQMAVVVLGNVIAIGMATFINNYTDQRQYPTYWGFGELNDFVKSLGAKDDDSEEDGTIKDDSTKSGKGGKNA